MTDNRVFHFAQFVRHENVEKFIKAGWEWSSGLVDTHHGEYSALMLWPHESEPPKVHEED